MTAPTAQEIEQAMLASLGEFPTVAQYVQAGDPRVLAQLRAQAAMLAMVAENMDVAQYEAFVKSRDSTVLADATLKGILPLARPCAVSLNLTNSDVADFTLAAGRRIVDPKGRIFTVDADVTILAGATAAVAVTQQTERIVTHTVQVPTPFYRMEVTPGPANNTYVSELSVWLGTQQFTYIPDWFNVQPGDFAYQAETDELRRFMVCMGSTDVVGYGVQVGDSFELRVVECEGQIDDLAVGSSFALEYVYTVADGKQSMTLAAVNDTGANPPTSADLRVMARYPSVYDHNAVYLGEFDMLLRRYMTGVQFLSVWNEEIEEFFRGPDVSQINMLFIAGRVDGMTDSQFQARAKDLIARADDSYGTTFMEVVDYAVSVTITGEIASVHDRDAVAAQIQGAILAEYGAGSPTVSTGMNNPLRVQAISALLRAKIPALQDDISDFDVQIAMVGTPLPEQFVQITADSLEIVLDYAEHNSGLWNR